MSVADALHHDGLAILVALDVERAAGPDGYPSRVGQVHESIPEGTRTDGSGHPEVGVLGMRIGMIRIPFYA